MRAVAAGPLAPDLSARRSLGRRWLPILLGYGVLLSACFEFAARSPLGYWVSNALVAAMGVHAIVSADLPPSYFGLTRRGALRSLATALGSTALLLAGGALLLYRFGSGAASPTPGVGPEMMAYLLLSVPVQELVFRGVLQGGVRFLLGGDRRASFLAILLSTLAFSAIHLPWGAPAALLVTIPGLVWGIQFERDRSLLGVTLSHVAVGYVYMGALPLWSLVALG